MYEISDRLKKLRANAQEEQFQGDSQKKDEEGTQNDGASSGGYQMSDRLKRLMGQATEAKKVPSQTSGYQMSDRLKGLSGRIDQDYINRYVNDSDTFLQGSVDSLNNMGYSDMMSGSWKESYQKKRDDLVSRRKSIRSYLQENRGRLDGASIANLLDYLDQTEQSYMKINSAYEDRYNYFSQWETEEDYDTAVKQWKERAAMLDYDAASGEEEISSLAGRIASLEEAKKAYVDDWNAMPRPSVEYQQYEDTVKGYDDQIAELKKQKSEKEQYHNDAKQYQETYKLTQYYSDYANAEDFSEKSKYVPQEERKQRAIDIMLDNYSDSAAPWDYPLYEHINGNKDATAWLSQQGANYFGPEGGAISKVWARTTKDKREALQMTPEEVATFNYLYATQGMAAANEYYGFLETDLNLRQRVADDIAWREYASESPVGASVFSTLISPMKGLGYLEQLGDYLGDRKLEPNAPYNRISYTQASIRGQVAQEIEESGKWGKVGSFAYQTGMSMGDFLMNTVLAGNNQAVALTIMGTGAAADATIAAKDRGLSDDQSFALGTIAGIAEAAMESINMETIFSPDMLKDGIAKFLMKNAASEGMEEVGTDIVNLFADILISKDQSEWQTSIDHYVAKGMSYSEAVGKAIGDQAMQMGADFLGGAVSGALMSSTTAGINTAVNNYNSGVDIVKADGGTDALLNLANEVAGVSSPDIQKKIAKQSEKVEKKATPGRVGKLYNTVENANNQANSSANQSDIAKSLRRKGFSSETANDIAEAVVASYNGQELTGTQTKLLKSVEKNSVAMEAISQIMDNPKSTVGQRSRSIRQFQEDIARGNIAPAQTKADTTSLPGSAVRKEMRSAVSTDTQSKNGAERRTGGIVSDDVAREYRVFWDAGFRGTAVDEVEWKGNSLTTEQKAKAWKDGAAAAAASIEKGKKSGFANYGNKGAVIDSPEALDLKRGDSKTYKNLQSFAQSWGVNIQIGDYGDAVNGSIRDGVIRLNARKFKGAGKTQVIARILAHEVTHRMQETAGEAYAKYRSYALETNARKNGGSLDGIIEAYQQKYADAGETLTREEAMDEIAADYTQKFLEDTKLFKEFINQSSEHRSIGRKLIDAVKSVVAKIKAAFSSKANRDAASQEAFGEDLNRVEQALKLWEQAYAEGQKAVKKATVNTATTAMVSKNSSSVSENSIDVYAGVDLSNNLGVYTYDFLTSLPDMNITTLPKIDAVRTNGKVDTSKVVSEGMKNARSVGEERDGKIYVKNRYTGRSLRVDVAGIRHGLNGNMNRLLTNARISAVIGDVVQNAVPINALQNKAEGVLGTYAMAQYATDSKGREFVAIVTVEQRNGSVSGFEVYDVVHAVSGRQKNGSRASTELQGVYPSTTTTKSIAEFLDVVKTTHQSILSEDVLLHFSEVRNPNGYYYGKAKYSYSIDGTEDILFEFEKQSAEEQDRRYAEAARRVDLRAASQMVDSKAKSWGAITDDTGAPKRFYHGTSDGGFTEFDAYGHGRFGLFGIGSYFTENLSVAESYTKKGKGENPQVYSVFLKANNLIDMDADADIRQWQNSVKDAWDYFSGCKTNDDCFKAIKEYCEDEMMVRWEAEEYITDVIRGMGYDGITHIGGGRFNQKDGTRHRVVIVFEPEQIRSASIKTYDNSGNLIPLSQRFSQNPDYRYSLAGTEDLIDEVARKRFQEARKRYGTIQPGENPAREVILPKKSAPGQKVSQTIRTALEAGVTPDVLVPRIADGVISGEYSDEVHTNKATLANAKAWAETHADVNVALNEWNKNVFKGKLLNENDTVKGYLLYNMLATNAANAESVEMQERYAQDAIEVLTQIANMTRESARMVQATRLLKRLTPEGKYFSLERAVERLNQQIADATTDITLKKGQKKLEINKELASEWLTALHAGNQIKAEQLEEQLYKSIAKQVDRNFMDKWNAWRYLSMLGNVKTLARNLVGNLAMGPAKLAKDKLSAALELVLPVEKRTKHLGWTHGKVGAPIREYAKTDFTNVQKMLPNNEKYNDFSSQRLMQAIREYKSKFQAPGLKQWQQITDWVMNGNLIGDAAFLRKHYTNSFVQIAMVRGWTAEMILSGQIPQHVLDEARGKAYLEAQKATFRDINGFSNAMRKMRFKGKSGWAKFGNIIAEGVLPFRSTPANVLVRAVEYSPIEILWNLTAGTWNVWRGNITASEYIDRFASGLTGTGIFALGMLLAGMGLVSGGSPDDDDTRTGYQKYSLNVGGKSFSLDWLSPIAIPFFMGVETENAVSDGINSGELVTAFASSFQPILEMSCLSGVNGLLDSMTYSDGADASQLAYTFFIHPFISYLSQGIPTLSSQTANATEKLGEKTYVSDISDQFARNIVYDLVKVAEKIPGIDWRQVPRIDAWGRVDDGTGVFESFISPAYINNIKVTDADREIERIQSIFQEHLNEVNKKLSKATTWQQKHALRQQATRLQDLMNISPDTASTKIGNIRLTQQEYIDYASVKGQQNYELVTALMDTAWYKSLTDEQKSAAIRNAYEWADARGQYAAVGVIKNGFNETTLKCDTETSILYIQEKMENNWKWQKQNPASELSESAALKYERSLKTYGIELDVWEDVWSYKSGQKKKDVLAYIHSKPLTVKQKDALYYACDYAASKLKEAPWHCGK